mmetsp:Transcript_10126/g.1502  ORF Transcript_10126/g.1502 Transcript_10126/m.1502 type:complete len:84 (-) Transcript_10126:211-462(-)
MIVMEYISNGSLSSYMQQTEIDQRQKVQFGLDIAYGMCFLHEQDPPIIHRDLKPMNCLVDHGLRVKIADFGLAKIKEQTIKES